MSQSAGSSSKISPELLRKIKDKVSILEIVGEHVVLRKQGANYTGLCPFHSERSPSFSVSEQKQLFHCYGCKAGGDMISFLVDLHGITFIEAVEELASRAGISLEGVIKRSASGADGPGSGGQRDEMAVAFKLNRFAAAFYRNSLAQSAEARGYLDERGITGDLEREFYAGYAPAEWEGLAKRLMDAKAPLEMAARLGLIRPSSPGAKSSVTGHFDLFRNRAMFPILDLRGRVAGFGGRILPGDASSSVDGAHTPKYLNSPESPLFRKSKLAFGLFQAKKHIRELDELILVEGYFDVLGLHKAGLKQAVATCGTALTTEHLQIFQRLTSRIVLLFDGDTAGRDATDRAMETALGQGVIVHAAFLPEDIDPDEFAALPAQGEQPSGAERLQAMVREAKPLLDLRIDEQVQLATHGPEQKTQAIKKIGQWLALYQDPVGREVRVSALEQRLGIRRDLFGLPPLKSAPPAYPNSPAGGGPRVGMAVRPAARPVSASAKPGPSDKLLMVALAKWAEFQTDWNHAQLNLPPQTPLSELFQHPAFKDCASRLLARPEWETSRQDPAAVQALLFEQELPPALRSLLVETFIAEAGTPSEDIRLALSKGLARAWGAFSQKIEADLAEAAANQDSGRQAELMSMYLDVQKKRKELTGGAPDSPSS
ncbi:MAG: DNA primase [Bacteriovoracia bacterium]